MRLPSVTQAPPPEARRAEDPWSGSIRMAIHSFGRLPLWRNSAMDTAGRLARVFTEVRRADACDVAVRAN
jgi:hypothetical protein